MVGNPPKLEPRRHISRKGPVNQNQDDLFILGRMCGSRRGGGRQDPPPPPEKAQKMKGFFTILVWIPSIIGRQQNAISMAFRWRADDGPFILVTKLSRFITLTKLSGSAHGARFLIILNQRTCRATECVECKITHRNVHNRDCLNSEDCSLHFLRENL